MKKIIAILFFASIFVAPSANAWSKFGHDAVAYIAECNLTPKAKANIEKYLDKSIVYYASWLDEYRNTQEYKFINYWHMGRVDKDLYYTDAVRDPRGDCVSELEKAVDRLKGYKSLDDSTIVVNLKYIIHIVGDMHCPSHINYEDKVNYYVKLKGVNMKYHSVWDGGLLAAAHQWSYMDYQHQLDRYSKKQKEEIASGTPREWFHQSAVDCKVIYEWASDGAELGQDFVNKAHSLPEQQIIKAGYRLARVLNELFG